MSLDYSMSAAGASLGAARQALLKLPGFVEYSAEPNPRRGFRMTHTIQGPGVVLWLSEAEERSGANREFVAAPDVEFFLEASKDYDSVKRDLTIASVVREILRSSSGDAVFYFTQSDRPLLHRQNGTIFVDDDPNNFWLWKRSVLGWKKPVLEALELEHVLKRLPKW